MRIIRYNKMTIGNPSVLELSDFKGCRGKQMTTQELANKMIKRSSMWIIEGVEPIGWTYALYELLRALKSKGATSIRLISNEYGYDFLRSITVTDDILDLCDEFVGQNNKLINVRGY